MLGQSSVHRHRASSPAHLTVRAKKQKVPFQLIEKINKYCVWLVDLNTYQTAHVVNTVASRSPASCYSLPFDLKKPKASPPSTISPSSILLIQLQK